MQHCHEPVSGPCTFALRKFADLLPKPPCNTRRSRPRDDSLRTAACLRDVYRYIGRCQCESRDALPESLAAGRCNYSQLVGALGYVAFGNTRSLIIFAYCIPTLLYRLLLRLNSQVWSEHSNILAVWVLGCRRQIRCPIPQIRCACRMPPGATSTHRKPRFRSYA